MRSGKSLVVRAVFFMCWLCLLNAAVAQYSTQEIHLDEGWNGVYLRVQPDDAQCRAVFSGWPVESVSLYNMNQTAVQFTTSPDEPQSPQDDYLTWVPTDIAGLNVLNSVLAGHSYLIYATNSCTKILTGRPVVPRTLWTSLSTNRVILAGFCVGENATFGTYLNGLGVDSSGFEAHAVGGTNYTHMAIPIGMSAWNGSVDGEKVESSAAYFFSFSDNLVSDFSGPIKVSPADSDGVHFYENYSYKSLKIENEHGNNLTVTVNLVASVPAPNGSLPVLPMLYYKEVLKDWKPWTAAISKKVEAGQSWDIQLAVDRLDMVVGESYGGVFVLTDTAGSRVEVPLEVDYSDSYSAVWPAGLWVGEAVLSEVSQMLGDGTVIDGQQAGSTMKYRLILHVDEGGDCRLLQRVIVSGSEDDDGNWNTKLYRDEADVPADTTAVRISSVALGLKNDVSWDETAGEFGDTLRFNYVIDASDPVNPFLHSRHPQHDGLGFDFKTPLPSGDNFINYVAEIKPETFSISNTITMVWNDESEGAGSALWNPEETATGTFSHQIDGLRKEGAILMDGTFEIQRVSQVGTLTVE